MAAKKRWSDLAPGTRRLLVVGIAAETALKAAALVDLARRPADEVRGSKLRWAAFVALVNAFGAAPVSYFLFGRRRG
ncbi:MAG TPA: hypothetical protein VF053_00450 [Streptosporangiales bacterium]